ncbi:GNA1 acetyltransferase, partial [Polypterus senegalus]|nr:GNA1 acetyltransferase [Polypterus senegalus]
MMRGCKVVMTMQRIIVAYFGTKFKVRSAIWKEPLINKLNTYRDFFKVLSQLTKAGDVTPEQFIKKFEHMKKTGDYYVVVVEDVNIGTIIATATLIIEHKFIHSCAKRGRIEEVVVTDECRGKQLGKLLVSTLTLMSKKLNCYKITLECLPKNVAFYEKFGYCTSAEAYMQHRFFD